MEEKRCGVCGQRVVALDHVSISCEEHERLKDAERVAFVVIREMKIRGQLGFPLYHYTTGAGDKYVMLEFNDEPFRLNPDGTFQDDEQRTIIDAAMRAESEGRE